MAADSIVCLFEESHTIALDNQSEQLMSLI